ncbi:type II secretion system protein, partial [bacterium]|nr:type II secretion system protein [bacterium]
MTNKHAINKQLTTHYSLLTKSAFTLAETLIVMGIIGVVAALTLPNLNSSTGDKEKIAKVKKVYSNLNDAIGRAQGVYGPIDEWFQKDTTATAQATRFGSRIAEFLKVSKDCGVTINSSCFSTGDYNTLKSKNGISNFNALNTYYKVILADGTSLAMHPEVSYNQIVFKFDIDGPNKGPNTAGKDLFHVD